MNPEIESKASQYTRGIVKRFHAGQMRRNDAGKGEQYQEHCFRVGMALAMAGAHSDTIVAGYLHDTFEDTQLTEDQLLKFYPRDGKEILRILDLVTRWPEQPKEAYIKEIMKDRQASIVKCADLIDNINLIKGHAWPSMVEDRERYRVTLIRISNHWQGDPEFDRVYPRLRNFNSGLPLKCFNK